MFNMHALSTGIAIWLCLAHHAFSQGTTTPVAVIPESTTDIASQIYTHTGPFDDTTRKNPTLNFFEKYIHGIENLQLDNEYPKFYALNCTFYNQNGTVFVGGPAIGAFTKGLFGPLQKLVINQHVHRVIPYSATPAVGDEGANNPQDHTNAKCGPNCTWILTEHELIFYLAAPLDGPGIPVRRAMHFLLGPAQIPGQGTDGKQWWEVKVWWDEKVLQDEIARRQQKLG